MSAAEAAAAWPGEEVPLAKVRAVLDRQYRELRASRARESGAGAPAGAPRHRSEGLMRTRIATLLVVGTDRDALAAALEDVRAQPGRHPSRCIALLTLPPGRGTSVRAFARVAQRGTGRQVYDEVVVEAAVSDEYLASVALPLLLPDIPVFTWWLGPPPFGSEALEELLGVTDRLVVDSADFAEPIRGLDRLARMAPGGPPSTDLAWGRLTPWRQMLVAAFTGRQRDALERLTQVAVTANQPAAGLLLLGWVIGRLGWRVAAPAGSAAAADGGRARYRAGDREVVAVLTPDGDGSAAIASIRLVADGGGDGDQVVVTVTDDGGALRATIDDRSRRRWPVAGGGCALTSSQTLQAELAVFGRDRIFEEALHAAIGWARGPRAASR
jgi:glucose-6-phosphate dehydrogenase assembly protein OpcA